MYSSSWNKINTNSVVYHIQVVSEASNIYSIFKQTQLQHYIGTTIFKDCKKLTQNGWLVFAKLRLAPTNLEKLTCCSHPSTYGHYSHVAIRATMAIACITDIFTITAIIVTLVIITFVSYKANVM